MIETCTVCETFIEKNKPGLSWHVRFRQDIADSQLLDLRQEGVLASGFAMGYCLGPVTMGILLDSWQVLAQTPDIPRPLLKLGFSTTTTNFNQFQSDFLEILGLCLAV